MGLTTHSQIHRCVKSHVSAQWATNMSQLMPITDQNNIQDILAPVSTVCQHRLFTPNSQDESFEVISDHYVRHGPCCKGKPCHRLGECEDSRKRKGRSSSRHKRSDIAYIRKLPNLNRDEGRYHLSHLYDNLLGAAAHT